jgi:hypothetical protein
MRCYCCGLEVPVARRVKLRPWRDCPDPAAGPAAAAYGFYVRTMTYRWAVVCLACYRRLDNDCGLAEIAGKAFNLAEANEGVMFGSDAVRRRGRVGWYSPTMRRV